MCFTSWQIRIIWPGLFCGKQEFHFFKLSQKKPLNFTMAMGKVARISIETKLWILFLFNESKSAGKIKKVSIVVREAWRTSKSTERAHVFEKESCYEMVCYNMIWEDVIWYVFSHVLSSVTLCPLSRNFRPFFEKNVTLCPPSRNVRLFFKKIARLIFLKSLRFVLLHRMFVPFRK